MVYFFIAMSTCPSVMDNYTSIHFIDREKYYVFVVKSVNVYHILLALGQLYVMYWIIGRSSCYSCGVVMIFTLFNESLIKFKYMWFSPLIRNINNKWINFSVCNDNKVFVSVWHAWFDLYFMHIDDW